MREQQYGAETSHTIHVGAVDERFLACQSADRGLTPSEYIRLVFLRALDEEPTISPLAVTLAKMRRTVADEEPVAPPALVPVPADRKSGQR